MFSDEEKNEIYRKYKLSEEEHMELYGKIKKIWTMDKTPVDNPVAVIVGGQTGAGKTGLIIYSKKMFADGNVVVINSDEIKPFHPKSEEIAREYPGEYTWITAQESEDWTSRLFGEVRNEGYNIIFEVPMKNNRIADDAIVDLLNKGYTVIVRGLAVCDLESRLSILERYEEQVAKRGWGRLVLPEHHDATYNGMPNTIKYIEETGRYDILEIFRRGEALGAPELIFGKVNPKSQEKVEASVANKDFVTKSNGKTLYKDARTAILDYRQEDYDRTINGCCDRFRELKSSIDTRKASKNSVSEEEEQETDRIFLGLMKYYEQLKKDREKSGQTEEVHSSVSEQEKEIIENEEEQSKIDLDER